MRDETRTTQDVYYIPVLRKFVQVAELLEGGWHVECEENIPLTSGQKRAQNWRLLEMPPETQSAVGLFEPNNLSAIYDTLGNGDLKVPGMDGREKALEIIAELLDGEPMEVQTGDPMMPLRLMPSVQAAEFEDDHMLMATVVKEWAQTRTGREHKKNNRRGYDNVIAWGMVHLEMANMAQAGGAPPPSPSGLPAPPPVAGVGAPPPPGMPGLLPPQQEATPPPEEMAAANLEGI